MSHRGSQEPDETQAQSLGLPADATRAEIQAARDRLAAQLAEADALLAAATPADEDATDRSLTRDGSDRSLSERSESKGSDGSFDPEGTYADMSLFEADAAPTTTPAEPKAKKRARAKRGPAARPAQASKPPVKKSTANPTDRRRRLTLVLLVILVPALVFGVYYLGMPKQATAGQQPPGHPDTSQMASADATLDPAKVQALKDRLATNPNDTAVLRELAMMHMKAGDFAAAQGWLEQYLAQEPADADGRLVLGVALFNQGNLDGAEREWQQVAKEQPNSPDPHYNLGFLYMGKNPPDFDRTEAEWRKVVELAPDSELAKNVQTHLEKLNDGSIPTTAPKQD